MLFASARNIGVAAAVLLFGTSVAGQEVGDLHFAEALYYAHQERYFDALQRLDAEMAQHYGVDEPELDSLHPYIDHAEFSVGDFELRYRMHHRAGRAIEAVLEGDVPEPVRNEAAFRLARIHFQKSRFDDALKALETIGGEVPGDTREDIEYLRGNLYLATGRAAEAVSVLRDLQGSRGLNGFAEYNLGIAFLREGRASEAIDQLDKAGQVEGRDEAVLAIRDKANLVLGTLLLESTEFDTAQRSLDRVRLEGPFSNQALLRAGWADASAANFERALVPWSILARRGSTDAAVQEAMLALPYAYSELNVHGRAALLYGRAVETFGKELEKLDASVASVRSGAFLKALAREEIRTDSEWVIHLRRLPDAPETFYLMELMASHAFQTGLQNYLDLEDMRKRLESWRGHLDSFEDVIRLRREYYEPLLPEIDQEFRGLDARIRVRREQLKHVDQRLQDLLVSPRPEHLQTAVERAASMRVHRLEAALAGASHPDADALRARVRRLKGVLLWNLETEYHQRLTDAHEHLREVKEDVETMTARYDSFVRVRQAATHSYVGFDAQIDGLRQRIVGALDRMDILMARQGHMLEEVASRELGHRRERLENYLNQARFAFADSYDRASKAPVQ